MIYFPDEPKPPAFSGHAIQWQGSFPETAQSEAQHENTRLWNARELGACMFEWRNVNTAGGHVHLRYFWARVLMEIAG